MKKKIKDCTFKEFTGWANAMERLQLLERV